MPVSPEEFGSLAYKPRETPPKPFRAPNPVAKTVVGFVFAAVVLFMFLIFPTLRRLPVGPSHNVSGIVMAVGLGSRTGLVASVRLANGSIVRVRLPYSSKLSAGSPVVLSEQPVRYGQPIYAYVRVHGTGS